MNSTVNSNRIHISYLTNEIIKIIGEEKAYLLLSALGGTEVYLSAKPTKENRAVRVIGIDSVIKLANHFGNGIKNVRIELPQNKTWLKNKRNDEIRKLEAQCVSKQQIALFYKLSTRAVRIICNNENKEHPFKIHHLMVHNKL